MARVPDDSSMFEPRAAPYVASGQSTVVPAEASTPSSGTKSNARAVESTWQLEYDRDRIGEAIRQLTDAEGSARPKFTIRSGRHHLSSISRRIRGSTAPALLYEDPML